MNAIRASSWLERSQALQRGVAKTFVPIDHGCRTIVCSRNRDRNDLRTKAILRPCLRRSLLRQLAEPVTVLATDLPLLGHPLRGLKLGGRFMIFEVVAVNRLAHARIYWHR